MKRTIYILSFLVGLLGIVACDKDLVKDQVIPNSGIENPARIEQKIDSILSLMTLREKAGQMVNIGLPSILTGGYWDSRDSAVFDDEKFEHFMIENAVGSIHNTPGFLPDNEQWHELIKSIQDRVLLDSRMRIPILYGIDNIHGANYIKGSTMTPHQIGLAATWNRELVFKAAEITAYESMSASLPWNFNPNADVSTQPLWGRIGESFGEDPYLVGEMAKAYTQGYQGGNLRSDTHGGVCVKHFIGYGAGINGKDRAQALIPDHMLREYYLPPFQKQVKAGAMGVMISSNAVNGIPCHINYNYITEILKGELGFQGVVISDFSDVEFLMSAHEVAADMKEATKLAVNAGLDLLMNPYDTKPIDYLVELVEEGEVSMERIDDAVKRNLRLKYYLNLFEKPYVSPEDYPEFASEAHQEANYEMASESITLLKNNDILPLKKETKVFLTGYGANSMNILNGAWSRSFLGRDPQYNDESKLTLKDALENNLGSDQVLYAQGADYEALEDIETTLKLARQSDLIVVSVAEIPATEKPSDIDELDLPRAQQNLVKELSKLNKPIVLVGIMGRPRIIREIEPLVDAYLFAYLPGQEGGRAIADVLTGEINPSGRLPYTYPKFSGNYLPYYHKKPDIRDKNWGFNGFYPQYEFGFGLSYSDVQLGDLKMSHLEIHENEGLEFSMVLKNKSTESVKETVMVFLEDEVASISPDAKRLIGFYKVQLEGQNSIEINELIEADKFKILNINDQWVFEPGYVKIHIGSPSLGYQTQRINLKK